MEPRTEQVQAIEYGRTTCLLEAKDLREVPYDSFFLHARWTPDNGGSYLYTVQWMSEEGDRVIVDPDDEIRTAGDLIKKIEELELISVITEDDADELLDGFRFFPKLAERAKDGIKELVADKGGPIELRVLDAWNDRSLEQRALDVLGCVAFEDYLNAAEEEADEKGEGNFHLHWGEVHPFEKGDEGGSTIQRVQVNTRHSDEEKAKEELQLAYEFIMEDLDEERRETAPPAEPDCTGRSFMCGGTVYREFDPFSIEGNQFDLLIVRGWAIDV